MRHRLIRRSGRLRTSAAAALLACLAAVPSDDARAHRIEHVVAHADAVVVMLSYGAGQPVAGARYRVYGPDRGPAFAAGTTASDGSLAFRPDRAGTWRITVTDEGGHGAVVRVDVSDPGEPAAAAGEATADWVMLLAGVGYLFGAAGALALWRTRG
jgi:hypothetical protein